MYISPTMMSTNFTCI